MLSHDKNYLSHAFWGIIHRSMNLNLCDIKLSYTVILFYDLIYQTSGFSLSYDLLDYYRLTVYDSYISRRFKFILRWIIQTNGLLL